MILFRWTSEALRNYAPGDIIVMAPDVRRARLKAQSAFISFFCDMWGYDENDMDEWESDLLNEKLDLLDADLAAEPAIVETGAVCISGSD